MKVAKVTAFLLAGIGFVHLGYWRGSEQDWGLMLLDFFFAAFFVGIAVTDIMSSRNDLSNL